MSMKITRNDLKNYQNNILAIHELDDELKAAYNTYRSPSFSSDGSGKPLNPSSPTERAMKNIQRLEKKQNEFYAKIEACEDFVNGIQNGLIYAACRDHYINGFSWEATCNHLKNYRSKSVIISMVNNYFDEAGLE